MSVFDQTEPRLSAAHSGIKISTRKLGDFFIALSTFLIGFVFFEPAPYELLVLALIIVWFAFGLTLHRAFLPLTVLMLFYILGGIIAATQKTEMLSAFIYIVTTAFLSVSSIFFAAVIVKRPVERVRLIFKAYTAAAIISALVGILAYFHTFPGSETFIYASRARGTFQDPNVFSPFLVLALLYLAQQILTKPFKENISKIFALSILMLALLLAFSRAGWGLAVFCLAVLVIVLLASNRSNVLRARIFLLSLILLVGGVALILVALSFDAVSGLFAERAKLVQSYDSAHFGRFARYSYGLLWITEGPLGYGFGKFRETFGEDSHNVYLKAFTVHGWMGGTAYLTLVLSTLGFGFQHLFKKSPLQPYFQCVLITILGHSLVGLIVDTDRWRHVYLLYGLAWGIMATHAIWARQSRLKLPVKSRL